MNSDPVVARHTCIFNEPPKRVPSDRSVDGPVVGNGDIGVAAAGEPHEQMFYIGKNDFWSRSLFRPLPVGGVTLRIPELQGASYHQEQDLHLAEVRGRFVRDGFVVRTRCWTPASENFLLIELSCESEKPVTVHVDGWIYQTQWSASNSDSEPQPEIQEYPTEAGSDDGLIWTRRYAEPEKTQGFSAAVATRFLGADPRTNSDNQSKASASFELSPGRPVIIASAIVSSSDIDGGDTLAEAVRRAEGLASAVIEKLREEHRKWWADFWSASFIEIDDKRVEGYWYGAQHILACSNRTGVIAPGLWGNWITTDVMEWHGSYTLDYNFQSPYFGACSSNHPELAGPYYDAMLAFLPKSRELAAKMGWKGAYYPVAIGPYSHEDFECEGEANGMKWVGVFVAINFINHYYYTQDTTFLREKAYPLMIALADFWEDYLEEDEAGRYVVYHSSSGEGPYDNTNPIADLAFMRFLFNGLLVASEDLGVDAGRRAKWQDILDRLSAYPTKLIHGKRVFSTNEDQPKLWGVSEGGLYGEGFNGLFPVWPGGDVGLDSDPELLLTARNTLEDVQAWRGYNSFPVTYNAAVRVGYTATLFILSYVLEKDMTANLYVHQGGGGIETCGTTLAVNEMLLQSHEGVLRLFPVWPRNLPARFGRLRAFGAFLVSAELKDGKVANLAIESEKGKDCTVLNPWPEADVVVTETTDGNRATVSAQRDGERITFKTRPGGHYLVQKAEATT